MKIFVVLLLATVAAVSAVPLQSESSPEGWFVPRVDGSFDWMTKKQFDDEYKFIEPRAGTAQYYLYTKANPTTPKRLYLNDASSLSNSGFNRINPTRFIIHGWQNNYQSDVNVQVRNALLQTGSYNVICVDWSAKAETLNYASSKLAVPSIGAEVAGLIDFLNSSGGMSFSSLTLIGHSLGAHVAGFAGKRVTRGKVNVIIGLDPAYPLFTYSNCEARLCQTDASYVESIQTNGGNLGFLEPIGRGAFYPNGGKSQPGCGIDAAGSCAHSRSYIYYSESIVKNDFPSMACSGYLDAVANKCGNSYSNVKMGSPASYGSTGSYYVPVNSQAPYGRG